MTFRPVNDYVSARLRHLRNEKGWTLTVLARRAAIPLGTYSVMETGRSRISLEHLLRLQLVLGVEIWELWPNPRGKVNHATDEVLQAVVRAAYSWLPKPVTHQDILRAVCLVYDMDMEKLSSPSRERLFSEARAVATQLVGEFNHLTMVELSRLLNRDVSTLFHCLRRMRLRLLDDKDLSRRLIAARQMLS